MIGLIKTLFPICRSITEGLRNSLIILKNTLTNKNQKYFKIIKLNQVQYASIGVPKSG